MIDRGWPRWFGGSRGSKGFGATPSTRRLGSSAICWSAPSLAGIAPRRRRGRRLHPFDTGTKRPGLRFTHAPTPTAQHFGPYLGGLRVRLAISALHRVLPLPYTSDTDGSTREFAQLFGVGPADRSTRADGGRSSGPTQMRCTALRAELVRRRDHAATELRFEFAAKLQDEITAFDWIVAEQKVSHLDPRDADIYGWSNGILVQFQMHAGRISTWTQRPTSETTARARVTSTPALWQPFARRNAELAAHLLREA